MRISNGIALVLVALLGILAGCGGGSSSTASSSTLGGKAAVGFPIVSGAVKVACAGGSALNTTTDSTGAWTVTISGQTLPCAVEVANGTINGVANSTAYHSVATALGTVNVTPLTDLLVANLAGTDPSTWFAGVNASTLGQVNAAALSTALTKIRTALPALTALGTIDPVTLSFTAASGNAIDDMLSALKAALAASGMNYSSLLTAATGSTITVPAGLGTALTTSYANTTTGSSGATPSSAAGCTGNTALFFATYAKTYQAVASSYDGGTGHPTVAGFANGVSYPVVVNTDCTITVGGTFTLALQAGSLAGDPFPIPVKGNEQVIMTNPAIAYGNFELPAGPPLLLQFSDAAHTVNTITFGLNP